MHRLCRITKESHLKWRNASKWQRDGATKWQERCMCVVMSLDHPSFQGTCKVTSLHRYMYPAPVPIWNKSQREVWRCKKYPPICISLQWNYWQKFVLKPFCTDCTLVIKPYALSIKRFLGLDEIKYAYYFFVLDACLKMILAICLPFKLSKLELCYYLERRSHLHISQISYASHNRWKALSMRSYEVSRCAIQLNLNFICDGHIILSPWSLLGFVSDL